MSSKRASLAAVLAAVALAGCSSPSSAPKAPEAAAAPSLDGRCEASAAQFAVGKQASLELLEQARTRSGAQSARILGPQDSVTMEYRSDRLNLNADGSGVIIRVNCG